MVGEFECGGFRVSLGRQITRGVTLRSLVSLSENAEPCGKADFRRLAGCLQRCSGFSGVLQRKGQLRQNPKDAVTLRLKV